MSERGGFVPIQSLLSRIPSTSRDSSGLDSDISSSRGVHTSPMPIQQVTMPHVKNHAVHSDENEIEPMFREEKVCIYESQNIIFLGIWDKRKKRVYFHWGDSGSIISRRGSVWEVVLNNYLLAGLSLSQLQHIISVQNIWGDGLGKKAADLEFLEVFLEWLEINS